MTFLDVTIFPDIPAVGHPAPQFSRYCCISCRTAAVTLETSLGDGPVTLAFWLAGHCLPPPSPLSPSLQWKVTGGPEISRPFKLIAREAAVHLGEFRAFFSIFFVSSNSGMSIRTWGEVWVERRGFFLVGEICIVDLIFRMVSFGKVCGFAYWNGDTPFYDFTQGGHQ